MICEFEKEYMLKAGQISKKEPGYVMPYKQEAKF